MLRLFIPLQNKAITKEEPTLLTEKGTKENLCSAIKGREVFTLFSWYTWTYEYSIKMTSHHCQISFIARLWFFSGKSSCLASAAEFAQRGKRSRKRGQSTLKATKYTLCGNQAEWMRGVILAKPLQRKGAGWGGKSEGGWVTKPQVFCDVSRRRAVFVKGIMARRHRKDYCKKFPWKK